MNDERTTTQKKIAVLRLAANPVSKLGIMHAAFLSDLVARAIIEELTSEGFMKKASASRYIMTRSGEKWLDTVRYSGPIRLTRSAELRPDYGLCVTI